MGLRERGPKKSIGNQPRLADGAFDFGQAWACAFRGKH
jgi:hypothetical protein